MELREALHIIKDDFEENISEEGYKEEFASVLEAESCFIEFVSAVLKEPCDMKYNWEHRVAGKRTMNKCALGNVKDHIISQMSVCEKAEEKARAEGMTKKCIEMHHDMFCLYAGFLAQL